MREMKIESDIYKISNSYDILVNAAEWLIKKSKLRSENCPIVSGYKRNLIDTQPKLDMEIIFLQLKNYLMVYLLKPMLAQLAV